MMEQQQKRYKAAGYAIFAVAAGLLLCRIGAYFLNRGMDGLSELKRETLLDLIFSLAVQIGFCFLVPLLIYKFSQKNTVRQIFLDSNFKKTRPSTLLLSVPMGICALLLTITVSAIWLLIIRLMGYNYSPPAQIFPSKFNFGLFCLSVLLTAVLPAFCEEFAVRGTFFTAMRHTFAGRAIIIVMAVSFGLFHQNIQQLAYTALFGGFMAFIVIKTGSVYPAVVMHFVNNFMATLLDYGQYYKWGGGIVDKFYDALNSLGLVSLGIMAFVAFFTLYGLTRVVLTNSKKDNSETLITHLYKPTVRESAFYIGAIVITAAATVMTFAFGF